MNYNPDMRCFAKKVKLPPRLHPKLGGRTIQAMSQAPKYQACGERLADSRKALGYASAAAFARVLGLSGQTYRNFERGDRFPDPEQLAQFHDAGIGLTYYITGDGLRFNPSAAKIRQIS